MARERSPERIRAKDKYIESGGKISHKELAELYGVKAQTIRKWKCLDKWDEELKAKYPPHRGAQQGNSNAKGHGAPKGNTNALKHGGYSKVFFENLSDEEKALLKSLTNDVLQNLTLEYQTLVIQEMRIKNEIAKLECATVDELDTDTVTVRETLKTKEEREDEDLQRAADIAAEVYIADADIYVGKHSKPGEKLHMRITNNSSAFNRKMKLEDLLIKKQGRIIKVLSEMRNCENERLRIGIERRKLSLAHSRITGEFDISPDIPEYESDEEQ